MLNLEKYTKFHSPGYVIEIYNKGEEKEIIYGNRETKPHVEKVNKNTLYDIASLTKAYTATLVYVAYEEKKLDLNQIVFEIDNHFTNLKEVSILDLLSHNQEIWTDGYLGNASTKEEFYTILYSAYVKTNFPTYVDVHYIILSTLLEKIYQKKFATILEEKIFRKLDLKNTTTNPQGENIASNNYEIQDGKEIDLVKPGYIHDTKGRIAKFLGITTRHASIFTTGNDILKFLKSFLDKSLLKKETIDLMLSYEDRNKKNLDNLKQFGEEKEINQMYKEVKEKNKNLRAMRTYNYMGTRYKNKIEELNDVPKNASENTIVFSGFTGPSFLIDFEREIIIVVMCNFMHRTKLLRDERKKNTDKIIEEIYNQIIGDFNI